MRVLYGTVDGKPICGGAMIWQWGAVLMASAGLTIGVGGRDATRHNQTITFVRNPAQDGTAIRVTARGPVDGFGSVRVLDFVADAERGTFRGVWELAFRTGTIRYAFAGTARFGAQPALAAGPALAAIGGAVLVPAPSTAPASRALVNGEFRMGAGTGRLADLTGRGAFHGWTLPNPPALTAYQNVD